MPFRLSGFSQSVDRGTRKVMARERKRLRAVKKVGRR